MLLGRGAQLEIEAAAGLLFERAADGVGIQQEGVEHDVVLEAAGFDAEAGEREQGGLHVAGDLGGGGVFEPGLQVRQVFGGDGARLAGLPGEADGIERELAFGRISEIATATGAPSANGGEPGVAARRRSARTAVIARRGRPRAGPSSFSRLWNSSSL